MEEAPVHIFFDYIQVKSLWERLQRKLQKDSILLSLTLQTPILRLFNEEYDSYNLLSHILLICKCFISIKGQIHTKYRYCNCQLNESKEKVEENKTCYQQ